MSERSRVKQVNLNSVISRFRCFCCLVFFFIIILSLSMVAVKGFQFSTRTTNTSAIYANERNIFGCWFRWQNSKKVIIIFRYVKYLPFCCCCICTTKATQLNHEGGGIRFCFVFFFLFETKQYFVWTHTNCKSFLLRFTFSRVFNLPNIIMFIDKWVC